jgi:NADH-quinone oxidoreductase E subunit
MTGSRSNGNGNGREPRSFAFTAENLERAKAAIAKYPEGRKASAVMPLLDLAQRQHGWLPRAAIEYVAGLLEMPLIRAYEVATFYSMYHLEPGGEHRVNVCTTTPCWLRGSSEVVAACEKALGVKLGETTGDGRFTLDEVECLGACVNAPVLQVDDDYYEDVDGGRAEAVLEAFKRGERPEPGPQVERQTSAPESGPTALLESAGEA